MKIRFIRPYWSRIREDCFGDYIIRITGGRLESVDNVEFWSDSWRTFKDIYSAEFCELDGVNNAFEERMRIINIRRNR